MFFVYIIYSDKFDKYYKGFSTNPHQRLVQHNSGESRYTKSFTPWKLIYIESFENKTQALKREKGLKKYSKSQIKYLVSTSKNELHK